MAHERVAAAGTQSAPGPVVAAARRGRGTRGPGAAEGRLNPPTARAETSVAELFHACAAVSSLGLPRPDF